METGRITTAAVIALALLLTVGVGTAAAAAEPVADPATDASTSNCDIFCIKRCDNGGFAIFILGSGTPCTAG